MYVQLNFFKQILLYISISQQLNDMTENEININRLFKIFLLREIHYQPHFFRKIFKIYILDFSRFFGTSGHLALSTQFHASNK